MSLDKFCYEQIYSKLNMYKTIFNPPGELKEITLPTENDNYWRNRQIQGEVHDEAASLLGGVSGNAGLFSNTEDLYKYVKALLNNGNIGFSFPISSTESQLFTENTVIEFTKKYENLSYNNSRALGWDTKPEPTSYRRPCGELISENSFGHTGYTGTSIWCDKDRKLVIIFLTNRIFPNRNNNGIRETRPELHNKIIEILSK